MAALKKFIRSKGLTVDKELNRFVEAIETAWDEAIKAIRENLEE